VVPDRALDVADKPPRVAGGRGPVLTEIGGLGGNQRATHGEPFNPPPRSTAGKVSRGFVKVDRAPAPAAVRRAMSRKD